MFKNSLGNKKIMAKNIQKYMDIKNIDRNKICNDLNIKYTTFSDWVNAKTYPRIDKIELMADYFGINKSDLVEENKDNTLKTKSYKIPVYGEIAAGIPIHAIEEILDYEEVDEHTFNRGELIALKVKGDSMEPRICSGDVVIIRLQNNIESGEVGAIMINGESATLKQVRKDKKGIYLIPFNNDYETTFYSNDEILDLPITIIGKVIELRGKF